MNNIKLAAIKFFSLSVAMTMAVACAPAEEEASDESGGAMTSDKSSSDSAPEIEYRKMCVEGGFRTAERVPAGTPSVVMNVSYEKGTDKVVFRSGEVFKTVADCGERGCSKAKCNPKP